MKRSLMRWVLISALVVCLLAVLGRRWVALGWSAWRYPTATATARTQVVVAAGRAYLAAGAEGVEVVDLESGTRRALVAPRSPADRIDDLALADGWLFALDATPPGHLVTYGLADPDLPSPAGDVVAVPVGPFSGVSAAAGVVVVSGGTSQLTLREYGSDGSFGDEVASDDYGRGQPDVALRPDGRLAAICTHLFGPDFAITFAEVRRRPLALRALSTFELEGTGFTAGGYKPARFPLVAAWRGDLVYVAHGGGLTTVDLSDPQRPRLVARDRRSRPAMDLALAGDELDVVRAGRAPTVVRYRLDHSGLPRSAALWSLPTGGGLAAIARHGDDLVVTRHGEPWLRVPGAELSRISDD